MSQLGRAAGRSTFDMSAPRSRRPGSRALARRRGFAAALPIKRDMARLTLPTSRACTWQKRRTPRSSRPSFAAKVPACRSLHSNFASYSPSKPTPNSFRVTFDSTLQLGQCCSRSASPRRKRSPQRCTKPASVATSTALRSTSHKTVSSCSTPTVPQRRSFGEWRWPTGKVRSIGGSLMLRGAQWCRWCPGWTASIRIAGR